MTQKMDFGHALGAAIMQAMEADPKIFIYGEGINDPGGFFGSSEGIAQKFSEERCFDVPNSEEALAGMGVGASLMGYRPIFVNLRMEFLLLAMNQVANHAARWSHMTGYQTKLPFTIRAMIGKSWGQAAQHAGGFHSLFAHVPGLTVVAPGTFEDGPGLLLSCIFSGSPCVFIEGKPLYDLSGEISLPVKPLPLGRATVEIPGRDITFAAVSYMVPFAKELALALREEKGIRAEVLNLRTLAPMDEAAVARSVSKTRRVAVFDVGWPRFGLAAEVARVLASRVPGVLRAPLAHVTRRDEHTPASCFLEYDHYPKPQEAKRAVLALFKK